MCVETDTPIQPPAQSPQAPAPGAASHAPAQRTGDLVRRLGLAGPLAVGAVALPPLGTLVLFLTLGYTAPWLQAQGDMGPWIYAACFAVLAGLALLPTVSQAAIGGFIFGMTLGLPAALAGFVGGGLIGYEVGRRASGDRVVRIIEERPKMRAVRDALIGPEGGHGFWKTLGIVTLVRVPPNSPFALTNLVMASVHVPRVPYLLGTLIGMAPRTAAAVFVGQSVERITTNKDISNATPWWLWAAGVGALVVVVVVLGAISKRALERVTPAAR